jgi:pimeloyl-ACP methyl ester carboxylesterase
MALSTAVAPTDKYSRYRAEVEARLAGTLRGRERRRLEAELPLLERARFVELDGLAHHYIEAGPPGGEPLILVHGLACSAYWWRRIVDPLARAGYRVIAYDLKGHGFSEDDPRGDYTAAAFSDELGALVAALGLGSHHVAACSLGSLVALRHAVDQPAEVRSLALFNFGLIGPVRLAALSATLDLLVNRVLRPIERRAPWWIPYLFAQTLLAKNAIPPSEMRLAAFALRCCDPAAVRAAARELARRELPEVIGEQMGSLGQPALLVAGAHDPIMHPQGARRLIAMAPNGQYLEVPRCGHLLPLELPEQVVSILRLFLRGARG